MTDWISCRLADACQSIDYGLTASATLVPTGPKFLRITDIVSTALDWTCVPYVAGDMRELERYKLDHNDIVIARTGATTGESYFIQKPPDAVFASYLVRLKIKSQFDPRYIAYWLKAPEFRNYLAGVLGDKSAQPNASASTMTNSPIKLPSSRSYQRSVSDVLGALDDKIELNRQMNETLEQMARAIFRDWFVDFGPTRTKMAMRGEDPQKEGITPKPYLAPDLWSLFPDRLDEEGKPEGWEMVPLDTIAEFLNGLALQKYPPNESGSLPVLKISQLRAGSCDGADLAAADLPEQYVIQDGDHIFSWSGSLMHRIWAGGKSVLNQHLFKVSPIRVPQWYSYFAVDQHLPAFQTIAASKATTMGHIQRHHLSQAAVTFAPASVMSAADLLARPLFTKMLNCHLESRTLAETRDLLLPKLMSGEVRVKEAEKKMQELL